MDLTDPRAFLKRLRLWARLQLIRRVAAPLIDAELREAGTRLYHYAPKVDRLLPIDTFSGNTVRYLRLARRGSDVWYPALNQLGLKGRAALDVGANCGYTTAWLAERCERVYAFEPHPQNVALIEEQLRIRNLSNVELIPAAVSDRAGEATLHVKPSRAHHSLDDIGASETLSTMRVPTLTLDDFAREHELDDVALLKLDVEGFEPDVLAGARELLEAGRIEWILFECTPPFYRLRGMDPLRPVQILREHGYELARPDGSAIGDATVSRSPQLDLLAHKT